MIPERWLWIELIGFDNGVADFGVTEFLARCGFCPDGISLLLFNADVVHSHDDVDGTLLPPDCCSYAGHPFNEERQRQDWTRGQLRGLIAELQRHGVPVYLAVFDLFGVPGWLGDHPEVLCICSDGTRIHSICPVKRLADGRFYEDFFIPALLRALAYYGFDGYHGADGYGHPRTPIYVGDVSDDLVDQFVSATGETLPALLAGSCDGQPERLAARAAWLWGHRQHAWMQFRTARFTAFWRKAVGSLHAAGKRVILNSTWTRDPFEAMYRYGVDYRELAAIGVDGFVVEAAAAASETERGQSTAAPLHEFAAMLMLLKARIPQVPLLYLNGVKDSLEQWNVIRHSPTALEREIECLSSVTIRLAQGGLARCSAGPMVCLADGLAPHEWAWLRARWDIAYGADPVDALGATLVWSDAALAPGLQDYAETRRWSVHRWLHRLLAAGAPIHSVVRIEDLGQVTGPVLLLNPHHLPEDERVLVRRQVAGPLIIIGPAAGGLGTPEWSWREAQAEDSVACHVFGGGADASWPSYVPVSPDPSPEDVRTRPDPPSFLDDLNFVPVTSSFVEVCAAVISRVSHAPRAEGASAAVIRVRTVVLGPDALRITVGNDSSAYVRATICVGRSVQHIEVLTAFPCMPLEPDGDRFTVRLPGRGVVVVRVTGLAPVSAGTL